MELVHKKLVDDQLEERKKLLDEEGIKARKAEGEKNSRARVAFGNIAFVNFPSERDRSREW
jgi:hypothetical protein